MTGLTRDGRELAEAIRAAMRQARCTGDDLGYINAHGSGTRQNDRHETAAFKRSLGMRAYEVPVSSIKSMIGHSLGAIGSLELAACALAIEYGVIPPTANYANPDPECDLDYVPNVAREQRVDTVLSVGSGFGGFQSAAVLARPPHEGGGAVTVAPGAATAAAGETATGGTGTAPPGAVVTGVGVVAPNGIGTAEYWAATLAYASGIGVIQRFDARAYPVRVGGEVLDFDADALLSQRMLKQTDRMTRYALAAADWALADAGLVPGDPGRPAPERPASGSTTWAC